MTDRLKNFQISVRFLVCFAKFLDIQNQVSIPGDFFDRQTQYLTYDSVIVPSFKSYQLKFQNIIELALKILRHLRTFAYFRVLSRLH